LLTYAGDKALDFTKQNNLITVDYQFQLQAYFWRDGLNTFVYSLNNNLNPQKANSLRSVTNITINVTSLSRVNRKAACIQELIHAIFGRLPEVMNLVRIIYGAGKTNFDFLVNEITTSSLRLNQNWVTHIFHQYMPTVQTINIDRFSFVKNNKPDLHHNVYLDLQ
jgi:hypothetical protein